MILDKLLEKKDLSAYIEYRLKFLSLTLEQEILKLPESDREILRQRFIGREKELKMMQKLIHEDKIKIMSKKYFNKINKGDEE